MRVWIETENGGARIVVDSGCDLLVLEPNAKDLEALRRPQMAPEGLLGIAPDNPDAEEALDRLLSNVRWRRTQSDDTERAFVDGIESLLDDMGDEDSDSQEQIKWIKRKLDRMLHDFHRSDLGRPDRGGSPDRSGTKRSDDPRG